MKTAPVLAVVVLYNTPLDQSETLRGLCQAFLDDSHLLDVVKVLIWDNSSEPITTPQLPIPFDYRHTQRNLGVSGAFNGGLEVALAGDHPWMLLLDQDTMVNSVFLATMMKHRAEVDQFHQIAAVAPTVFVGDFVVSPRQQRFNRHRAYPLGESGEAAGEPFAINSGCLMRVSSLAGIGGFSPDFWLDYSDMYVFHQFYLQGKKVWRAGNTRLEHDMSIMDYDRLMSESRYLNFSHAESAFNDLYKGNLENAVQTSRTLVRAIKQRFKYQNPAFSRIAWKQFLYRLRTTRKSRITRWHQDNQRRRNLTEPGKANAIHARTAECSMME